MTKTILTVDDSRSIRDMIAFALEPQGYRVVKAEDGKDGLAKARAERPDMIVTDLNMPVMNGIEMIRELRADASFNGLPIVMLTTEAQKEKMLEGKQAGATGWIVKPFDEAKITGVVAKLLG
ncbi:response regulator [Roseitranquillus sediminis]|uniref:response regulator n=1 Tax=Roseitranquillus sediminis TaxID=2809051 RepID=UPI001D0C9672|nr:response regulator [Roseitranquillus sediminis]MBM9593597.1 response regulator [Roseitranquillus sediminis]